MTRLVVRIKILPSDAEVNLDDLTKSVSETIPTGMELDSVSREPIAFGLYSLLMNFVLDDSEGQMTTLEDFLERTQGVGQFEVISISRKSVQIK